MGSKRKVGVGRSINPKPPDDSFDPTPIVVYASTDSRWNSFDQVVADQVGC